MIDEDGPEWARTVFRLFVAIYAAGFLVLLLVFVVGLAIGPAPPADPPPVDFSDHPSDVVWNAVDRLESADYTIDRWVAVYNSTSDRIDRGLFGRSHIRNSVGRMKVAAWRNPSAVDGRPDGPPTGGVWANRYGMTWTRDENESGWYRTSTGGTDYQPRPRLARLYVNSDERYPIVRNNSTHYRIKRVFQSDNASFKRVVLVVTVAKRPDPHFEGYRVRYVYNDSIQEFGARVTNYRTARAPRPQGVPPVTIEGLVGRSIAGWQRLL